MRKIKRILLVVLIALSFLCFAGCTKKDDDGNKGNQAEKSVTVTFNVYDIDGELLGSKEIKKDESFEGKKDGAAFQLLVDNFDVQYTESEYGPYITSINKSVSDANYYLALYENGAMSMVGINDIEVNDGDVYDFKVETWSTSKTANDLLIDKMVYSFMKKDLTKVFTDSYDYSLLQAIVKANKSFYDANLFDLNKIPNISNYKAQWTADQTGASLGNLFKASLGCVDFDLANDTIAPALNALNNKEELEIIWSIAYYLDACYNANVDNETYQAVLADFASILETSDPSDSVNMALAFYALFSSDENFEQNVKTILDKQTSCLGEDGFVDAWMGANSCSTAQLIIALVATGQDPTTYYGVDLVNILLRYQHDGLFNYQLSDAEADLAFSTPQCYAALLMYKLYRDAGNKAVSFFDVK